VGKFLDSFSFFWESFIIFFIYLFLRVCRIPIFARIQDLQVLPRIGKSIFKSKWPIIVEFDYYVLFFIFSKIVRIIFFVPSMNNKCLFTIHIINNFFYYFLYFFFLKNCIFLIATLVIIAGDTLNGS
jgi:hypothetical protein